MISSKSLLIALLFAVVAINAQFAGIGDRLWRTFDIFAENPMTVQNATAAGWSLVQGNCDPDLGIPYGYPSGGDPDKEYPLIIYFTGEGQISGIGMTHYGQPAAGLENFWVAQNDGTYLMTVSFRPNNGGNGLCDMNTVYQEPLGTQLVINQGSLNYEIPLNDSYAAEMQWTGPGGCIGKMGTHWSYDLATAPNMEWNVSTFLPLVTMYNNGALSAFFLTTPSLQYPEPLGIWEGPIPNSLMCLNWCDSSCDWNVNLFNTLHFFVTNPYNNQCPERCNNEF